MSLDDIRYGAMNHHNETVHKLRNTFETSSSMTYFSDIFCVLLSECVAKMLFNYILQKKIFNRFVNSFPIWNIWFSFDFEARCVRQARNSPYSLFHKTKYNTNKPCNSFDSIIDHIYLHYRNSKRITKENWSKKAERYLFKHNLSTHIVWCAVHIQLISKRFVI